ncbi:MAG: alanine--tRNA ligase [Gammaproteobacteria bacterium]|nr:alanine--tRNA ligase [Gammaproteobacteria bacterium]MCY4357054.1 alanine--tRNA ligase [Gammaproteobacteria bacterium]
MKSADIRQKFLDYFAAHDHKIVSGCPLVPANDPTLLFTNAGMVQFKDVFLGKEKRAYSRAVSSQRCVRAGGKHNDLENVGYTARHHTFFEMLGNFSFGDYFKREAIHFAWEFLTAELGLSPDKLWVTVYHNDDEAASIWLDEIKVDPIRFSRLGEKDNFWAMGDTGPCGPCSEIFFDHGPSVAGGPPGSAEEEGDRYIEIWNLVFMQFERKADGSMTPLPKPSVDTGAGLERLAAVLQNVHSNYEIDLFASIIRDVAEITGCSDLSNNSLQVIADHIRSCAFLVIDGVIPSNEGRGYVLRRIVRRAIRHGYLLGVKDSFFYRIVASLIREMGEAYPELVQQQLQVEKVLRDEEVQFARTLDNGMNILEQAINELEGDTILGATVFKLYDTYGFPVDLTADIAREHQLSLDMKGFDEAMAVQKRQARAASNFGSVSALALDFEGDTEFTGYDQLEDQCRVVAMFTLEKENLDIIPVGQEVIVVLDRTPFYAESGGQIGDQGTLSTKEASFEVLDTQKQGAVHLHRGILRHGILKKGDSVRALVADNDRAAITLNHSATHLMHSALRAVLGEHVLQRGSLVAADRLRFDFSHSSPVTSEQLKTIEHMVNQQILSNSSVNKEVMPIDAARKRGALALFGEKYGDEVRVVTMGGDYSIEFCGGCHVNRTGDIGLFRIVSESGISAGVRRIEAVTGHGAIQLVESQEKTLRNASALLKASPTDLITKLEALLQHNRNLEKDLEHLKYRLAKSAGDDLVCKAVKVRHSSLLVAQVEGFAPKSLRETVDRLKNKLGSSIILLATVADEKVSLVAGVSEDLTGQVKAGDLVNQVAQQIGGRGGGRPDMAMAGGKDAEALPAALEGAKLWIEQQLQG